VSRARLPSKLWTLLDDERLRSPVISGMDASEIATELERTVSALRARAERRLGGFAQAGNGCSSLRLAEVGLKAKK
jgi:hypothetical protein